MLLDKVKINRDVSKSRYKHLLKQIEEGIVTEEDLRLVQKWFEVGRFAPVQTRWKKVFSSGVKLVGFDSEPETLLGKLESAYSNELEFPSAFRQCRRNGKPRGIVKIEYGGQS